MTNMDGNVNQSKSKNDIHPLSKLIYIIGVILAAIYSWEQWGSFIITILVAPLSWLAVLVVFLLRLL